MTEQKISDEALALAKDMYLSRTNFDACLRIAQSAIDAAHDKALEDAAKQFDNRPASYPAVAQEIRAMKVGK